ncbi:unnamed protein product [Rangifer tarandus platyrhynchus]|uniref:Uncharacterized protein n=1 Tax=Rangifer tarandus platyrhynchus TaxID=3082113 RepID=A0AC59ZFD9_RANTA
MCPPTWNFSRPHTIRILGTEARSIINSIFRPSPFSREWRGEAEVFKLFITAWSFCGAALIQELHPESSHENRRHSHHPGKYTGFRSSVSAYGVRDQILEQKTLPVSYHLEITRVSGTLCQGLVADMNHIFSYYLTISIWYPEAGTVSPTMMSPVQLLACRRCSVAGCGRGPSLGVQW